MTQVTDPPGDEDLTDPLVEAYCGNCRQPVYTEKQRAVLWASAEDVIAKAAAEMSELSFKLTQATDDLAEMQASFDLRWDAGQRAIKRWQGATGKTEVWPDHADLCVWLMGELDRSRLQAFDDALDSLVPEDLEQIRDACQAKLDDLKDTWDDALKNGP